MILEDNLRTRDLRPSLEATLRSEIERTVKDEPDRSFLYGITVRVAYEVKEALAEDQALRKPWKKALQEFRQAYLATQLKEHGMNEKEAAEASGMSYGAFRQAMHRAGLKKEAIDPIEEATYLAAVKLSHTKEFYNPKFQHLLDQYQELLASTIGKAVAGQGIQGPIDTARPYLAAQKDFKQRYIAGQFEATQGDLKVAAERAGQDYKGFRASLYRQGLTVADLKGRRFKPNGLAASPKGQVLEEMDWAA